MPVIRPAGHRVNHDTRRPAVRRRLGIASRLVSPSRALLMLLAFVAFQLGYQAPIHFGHGVSFAAGMASVMIRRAKGGESDAMDVFGQRMVLL